MTTTPDNDSSGSQQNPGSEQPTVSLPQTHEAVHGAPGTDARHPAQSDLAAPVDHSTQSQPTVPLAGSVPLAPSPTTPAEGYPSGVPQFAAGVPVQGAVPSPDHAGHHGGAAAFQQHAEPQAFQQLGVDPNAQVHSAHPKNRTGALLAGLAIGALLGGIVGGGAAGAGGGRRAATPSRARRSRSRGS